MHNRTKVRAVYNRLKRHHGVRFLTAQKVAKGLFETLSSVQYALRYLADQGYAEFQGLGWQLTPAGAKAKIEWSNAPGWNEKRMLEVLTKNGPMMARDLARECNLSHQNVNKYARKLQKEGKVTLTETKAESGHRAYLIEAVS